MKWLPLFATILFVNCNDQSNEKETGNAVPATTDSVARPHLPADNDTSIFSVLINGERLSLRQWDTTIRQQLLPKEIKSRTWQLDAHSDTHAGSYIRVKEYPGIQLRYFSPRENGKTFWLQEIIVNKTGYPTTRGIQVGDSLHKVKQAYPELKPFPGANKDMYYVADAGYEQSMELEFAKGRLRQLRMYFMIP